MIDTKKVLNVCSDCMLVGLGLLVATCGGIDALQNVVKIAVTDSKK